MLKRHRFLMLSLGAAIGATQLAQAAPHDEGVLTVASSSIAAGAALEVQGEHFTASTAFSLMLKGALAEYEVATAESDDQGQFVLEITIPAEARPGSYRLVAVAPDGDDSGSADLTVTPAPAPAAADSDGDSPAEDRAALASRMPSAEQMTIERSWSGAEWFLIGLLTGGAFVAGLVLYRRPKESN